jgi:hypothetical protein
MMLPVGTRPNQIEKPAASNVAWSNIKHHDFNSSKVTCFLGLLPWRCLTRPLKDTHATRTGPPTFTRKVGNLMRAPPMCIPYTARTHTQREQTKHVFQMQLTSQRKRLACTYHRVIPHTKQPRGHECLELVRPGPWMCATQEAMTPSVHTMLNTHAHTSIRISFA